MAKNLAETIAVIPAFNEEKTIYRIAKESKKFVGEVIVVDDGSTDATAAIAEKAGATVLQNIVNMGKGNALRTGVKAAIRRRARIIITIDADGQHDPKDIKKLVAEMHEGNYDIVLGSRFLEGKMPLIKRFGNWFIYNSSKILFGVDIKDTQTGFKVFKAGVFGDICWESSGYSIESEIVKNIGKHGLLFKEVPIKKIYADDYKGTSIADGIKIFLNMLYWKITR